MNKKGKGEGEGEGKRREKRVVERCVREGEHTCEMET